MKKMSLILCALIATLVVLPVSAQSRGKNSGPTGTVTTANGQAKGGLRWRNSAKEYTVTNDRGMTVTYSADDVTNLVVDKPVELDPAIKKVMAGGAGLTSAIATLKNIASDYNHLTYDMEATRWLADAYMKQGNATEAVKACEDVIKTDESAAYKGEMAVIYWRALSKSGKASRLNTLLEKAIASGDQTSAASALVARGNAALDRGSAVANCREALKDGYLRVVLLYKDQPDAYAEALYMGAKAFDGMQQGARADKLRASLKAECPTSEWATRK